MAGRLQVLPCIRHWCQCEDGKYTIQYDDGEVDEDVKAAMIRNVPSLWEMVYFDALGASEVWAVRFLSMNPRE